MNFTARFQITLFALFFFSLLNCVQAAVHVPALKTIEDYQARGAVLRSVGERYCYFMNAFGNPENEGLSVEALEGLFADDVCKIVNGPIITKGKQALYDQLYSVFNVLKLWKVISSKIEVCQEDNFCLFTFTVGNDTVKNIVMKKLYLNEKDEIVVIDEVYNDLK